MTSQSCVDQWHGRSRKDRVLQTRARGARLLEQLRFHDAALVGVWHDVAMQQRIPHPWTSRITTVVKCHPK